MQQQRLQIKSWRIKAEDKQARVFIFSSLNPTLNPTLTNPA